MVGGQTVGGGLYWRRPVAPRRGGAISRCRKAIDPAFFAGQPLVEGRTPPGGAGVGGSAVRSHKGEAHSRRSQPRRSAAEDPSDFYMYLKVSKIIIMIIMIIMWD